MFEMEMKNKTKIEMPMKWNEMRIAHLILDEQEIV